MSTQTAKYLKLDLESIQDDFFSDTRLIGIVAPIKNYYLCWLLNTILEYNFLLNPECEIVLHKRKSNKDRKYYFPVYESREAGTPIVHYLYHNQNDGEYLLPEFKHVDYIWMIKGWSNEDNRPDNIKHSLKRIKLVQLVFDLSVDQIKNKDHMIFE
jgi:hypothetical protein